MSLLPHVQTPLFAFPSHFTIIALGVLLYVLYLLSLAIYRLYFSPLASFPGPKLTALTGWYETYLECFHNGGGQFTFHIRAWHEKYGPIVRINPWEIHIHDPLYYDTIYNTLPYDKLKENQYRFNAPHAAFSTPSHDHHRIRRSALAPFFSKRKVLAQAPFIQSRADKIMQRLRDEYKDTGRVLCLNDVFACFAGDVVTSYAFEKTYDFLGMPEFQSPFNKSIEGLKDLAHVIKHFPWVVKMAECLPEKAVVWMKPDIEPVLQFQAELKDQVLSVIRSKSAPTPDEDKHGTIFSQLLESSLPPHELTLERLHDEAISVIGAGIETTKWALTIACFHILDNPHVLQRLRAELEHAIPHAASIPPLSELEKLPYLKAVVDECVRLSYGTVGRSPRISHDKSFTYGAWKIPPGTPISMDTWHMHNDESLYPNAQSFRPERWLGEPKGPDGKSFLSRYMTAFGKGNRICLGMHMALAEITIGIATVFRGAGGELELFETTREEVDCVHDMLAPEPRRGGKGIRVLVN